MFFQVTKKKPRATRSKKWLMSLEIKLQCASCEWCIDKLKCHKIGSNDKIKAKEPIKKLPLLFLKLGMHKLRQNRQV